MPTPGSTIAASNGFELRNNSIDRDDNIADPNMKNSNKNPDIKHIKGKRGNKTCNFYNWELSPLKGFSLRRNVNYKFEVSTISESKEMYIESTNDYKTRCRAHTYLFTNQETKKLNSSCYPNY